MNAESQIQADHHEEAPEVHIEDVIVDQIRPRKVANLLLWIIVSFFVLFLIWAAVAQIDRSVHATGRVVPDSRLQVVSNLEGGIISQILVEAGELVERGQALIRLDPVQREGDYGASASTAQSLQAKIARLQGQLTGRTPVYPAGNSPASQQAISIEQALYGSEMSELASLTQTGEARILQSVRAVGEAEANYRSALSQARSYEQQLDMIRPLVERGLEPRLTLVQLESSAASAQAQAQAAQAGIARFQANVAEAQSSLSQAKQDWRSRVAAQLAESQAQLSALNRTLPALQDRVTRSLVTAPLDGIVNRVLVTTIGGAVGAGDPLVELVPAGETLMLETRLLPKDIGFVRIGQDARVSITAYPSNAYGSLEGTVVSISPDATVDPESGESFYTVQVRSTGSLEDAAGNPLPVGVGMTADVSILGEKRSVLSYLTAPFTRLGQRALRE